MTTINTTQALKSKILSDRFTANGDQWNTILDGNDDNITVDREETEEVNDLLDTYSNVIDAYLKSPLAAELFDKNGDLKDGSDMALITLLGTLESDNGALEIINLIESSYTEGEIPKDLAALTDIYKQLKETAGGAAAGDSGETADTSEAGEQEAVGETTDGPAEVGETTVEETTVEETTVEETTVEETTGDADFIELNQNGNLKGIDRSNILSDLQTDLEKHPGSWKKFNKIAEKFLDNAPESYLKNSTTDEIVEDLKTLITQPLLNTLVSTMRYRGTLDQLAGRGIAPDTINAIIGTNPSRSQRSHRNYNQFLRGIGPILEISTKEAKTESERVNIADNFNTLMNNKSFNLRDFATLGGEKIGRRRNQFPVPISKLLEVANDNDKQYVMKNRRKIGIDYLKNQASNAYDKISIHHGEDIKKAEKTFLSFIKDGVPHQALEYLLFSDKDNVNKLQVATLIDNKNNLKDLLDDLEIQSGELTPKAKRTLDEFITQWIGT